MRRRCRLCRLVRHDYDHCHRDGFVGAALSGQLLPSSIPAPLHRPRVTGPVVAHLKGPVDPALQLQTSRPIDVDCLRFEISRGSRADHEEDPPKRVQNGAIGSPSSSGRAPIYPDTGRRPGRLWCWRCWGSDLECPQKSLDGGFAAITQVLRHEHKGEEIAVCPAISAHLVVRHVGWPDCVERRSGAVDR